MRMGTLLAAVVLTACVLTEINCITNQEFFDQVKDYAEDLESFDLDDPAINDDDDDDNVIDLPGNADDELDVEYILTKLDLTDVVQSLEKAPSKDPTSLRLRGHCRCRGHHCECCLSHHFRLNLLVTVWKFKLSACVKVGYLKRHHGFYFSIFFNKHRVFHHEISLRKPPPLCFGIPYLRHLIRGCIEVYNINLRTKRMCLRVVAIIDIKIWHWRFPFKIGCFRIPMLEEVVGQDVTDLLENMEATVENKETGQIEEVSLADLPTFYRQLQIELRNTWSRNSKIKVGKPRVYF